MEVKREFFPMLIFPGVAAGYLVEKKTAHDVKMFHRTESRKTADFLRCKLLSVQALCPLKQGLWSKVKCHWSEESSVYLSVHHWLCL